MDDSKSWYLSKTAWSSLAQIVTGLMVGYHVINPGQANIINSEVPSLIISAVVTVLGAISLYGRLTATKTIKA